MAGRIDDSADAPAVFVGGGPDQPSACGDGAGANCGGIIDDKQHADRAAAEGFGAEVFVSGGFLGNPELGAIHRKTANAAARNAVRLYRGEGLFVKRHGFGPIGHRQRGGYRGTKAGNLG